MPVSFETRTAETRADCTVDPDASHPDIRQGGSFVSDDIGCVFWTTEETGPRWRRNMLCVSGGAF